MQSSTTWSDEEWARPGWQQHLLFKCHLCWSWLDPHCRGHWVLLKRTAQPQGAFMTALHPERIWQAGDRIHRPRQCSPRLMSAVKPLQHTQAGRPTVELARACAHPDKLIPLHQHSPIFAPTSVSVLCHAQHLHSCAGLAPEGAGKLHAACGLAARRCRRLWPQSVQAAPAQVKLLTLRK